MKKRIKDRLKSKTPEEIFSLSLFVSCIVVMLVLAIFRFCGIGYFANEYPEHKFIPWVQDTIMFVLKWIEFLFVLATLTKLKIVWVAIISFCYSNIYWFVDIYAISMLLDVFYFVFVPFFVSKFDYKRISYGIIVGIAVLAYQIITMLARYRIDLTLKFNYIAGIAVVFDYKIFILSIYLLAYNWRLKMQKINTPNPNDERNYGGGWCSFLFGPFEKICQIIGEIIVGICTLGIAPLSVYLYRKNKKKSEDETTV